MKRSLELPDSQGDLFSLLADEVSETTQTPSEVREAADFSVRNHHLAEAVTAIGVANRAAGAAAHMSYGGVIRRFDGPAHAIDRRDIKDHEARASISFACGECALREFCNFTPQTLQQTLRSDAKARTRFANRIKRADNDHLCATNMMPGRIPNDKE